MFPIFFEFGPIRFYSYGLFLALGFLVVSILAEAEGRRRGIVAGFVSHFCLLVLLAGIVGARLLFVALNLDFFLANPAEIIMLWHGGLVWYGGLAAAVVCGIVYLRGRRQPVIPFLNLLAPYIALGQSIGRIGCFFNGCCYGRPWPGMDILYPAQLISSLAMLCVFVVLRICHRRKHTFVLYLILCSAARFLIEYIRGDSPAIFFGLTIFQLISAAIFLSAVVYLLTLDLLMRVYKPSFARMLRRGTHPVDGSRALPTDKILASKLPH